MKLQCISLVLLVAGVGCRPTGGAVPRNQRVPSATNPAFTGAAQAPSAAAKPPAAASPTCHDEPGMAYIPGGDSRYRDKAYFWQPVHVEPFWMDRYEVTVEDYRECVEAGACTTPHPGVSGYSDQRRNPLVCTWEIEGVPRLPINCVDGRHEDDFCAWKGKRVPLSYEWVWAAQGREEHRKYPWGEAPATCEVAIVDENRDDEMRGCGLDRPWPVGSRSQDVTRDGLVDMLGNVAEWTVTAFRPDHPFGYLREAAGTSWATMVPTRGVESLSPGAIDNYSDNCGFRCAKDPGALPPCTVAP